MTCHRGAASIEVNTFLPAYPHSVSGPQPPFHHWLLPLDNRPHAPHCSCPAGRSEGKFIHTDTLFTTSISTDTKAIRATSQALAHRRLLQHIHSLTLSPHHILSNMAASYPDLKDRPLKDTICLFDVDGTLSLARQHATPEMLETLTKLRQKCAIGFVCPTLPSHQPKLTPDCDRSAVPTSSNKKSNSPPRPPPSSPSSTSASPKTA